jgi:nucleotide-binding universal stress UspA family protein
MRILIGYDGSEGAKDALELARVLTPFEDGEVTLVYVAGPSWPTTLSYEEMASGSLPEARELLADGSKAIGGEPKSTVYVGASPARVLTEAAEREDADLVVVGSPHRGPVGRALVGSVAERLLHGASCAVAVAPRGFAASRHAAPSVVAIAYDGGSDSKIALHRAEELARAAGATLRVLYVEEPLAAMPGIAAYTPPPAPDPAEIVAEARASVAPGVETEGRVLAGPAAGTLAEACEDGVDLLVVGSRGYGPLGRVLLGSVSTALLHKAPCPVLVAPRAAAPKPVEAPPAVSAVEQG